MVSLHHTSFFVMFTWETLLPFAVVCLEVISSWLMGQGSHALHLLIFIV